MPRSDRLGAAAGLVGAAGNVLGVVFLFDTPGAYRLAGLDQWAAGTAARPGDAVASAVAFTVGLVALAGWAIALGRRVRGPLARAGAAAMAAGALLNAFGTMTPAVLALHVAPACQPALAGCLPLARALLGLTLTLDGLFNLLFGLGLIATAVAAWRAERRPALGLLGLAAGLATLPVAAQFALDGAARLLALAGPLWLAFVLVTSALLWRGRRPTAAPGTAAQAGGPHGAVARAR